MKSFKLLSEIFAILAKVVFLLLLCFAGVSCGISELDSEDVGGTGIWVDKPDINGKPDIGGGNPVISEACYVTVVEYPEKYDWIGDFEKGSVKCSLVVYINGKPRMKVAVGDAYHISSDADMHRLIDGNLYTDYSTAEETIIKKNGEEICRWKGRESIKGMQVVDGNLYTIGNYRSGYGFAYRKNGEILFGKDDGYVYEHLTCESGNVMAFSFCELIRSQNSSMERYHVVRNGVSEQVAIREDIRRVWDVAMYQGSPCYVASLKGTDNLMLGIGDKAHMLSVPVGTKVLNARIFATSGSIYVEALVEKYDKKLLSVVWKDMKLNQSFMPGMTVASFACNEDGNVAWALNPVYVGDGSVICIGNNVHKPPFGYIVAGPKTSAFVNGILYVGLASTIREKPAIWKDGELEVMNFNGFITSVQSVSTFP